MDSRLDAAADAIDDGRAVDWDDLEASSEPSEAPLVRQLRVIAAVAAVHRADRTLAPGRWGPLQIVERIGGGSFGDVYRAHDPRLARDVALKLLKEAAPPAAASLAVEEGRLLARVRHPHVITVHGADIVDGRAGIWMELIEGRTLAAIVQADGPMAAHEAAAIGTVLCGALAAVHAAGLLHGDVKAQNVMRERGGRLVLMDFGAGRDARAAADDGALAATPAYSSPELLDGARPTPRTDIYALGVLLFHLATGSYPAEGRTRTELRQAARDGVRARLRDLRPDLPDAFVRAVERALAVDPAHRFATVGAFAEALTDDSRRDAGTRTSPGWMTRRHAAIVGLAAAIAVAGVAAPRWWRHRRAADATVAVERSIVVLPIANPARDANLEYVADGMTEGLIRELSAVRGLRVTSRTSSMFFKDRRATIRDIAGRLDIDLAVESSLLDRGEDLEVELTLVDARADKSVWTRRFVEPRSSPARLEADIALELLRQFGATRASPSRSPDDEAYRWYLKGRYQWNKRTAEGLRAAKEDYEKAIETDPTYALAHAGLAETYLLLGAFSWLADSEAFPRAELAAERALELDATLSPPHAVKGYLFSGRSEPSAAYSEYLRAIELDPNNVTARQWYALSLMAFNPSEAVRQIELARRLDPLSRIISSDAAVVYKRVGKWDEAIAQLERTIQLFPDFAEGYVQLGNIYEQRQEPARAASALQHAIDLGEDQAYVHAALVYNRAAAGETTAARAALQRLEALARHTFVPPGALAIAYGSLGEREKAQGYLNREASRDDVGKAASEMERKGGLFWLRLRANALLR